MSYSFSACQDYFCDSIITTDEDLPEQGVPSRKPELLGRLVTLVSLVLELCV